MEVAIGYCFCAVMGMWRDSPLTHFNEGNMGDVSQSRYSIVERLTTQKLEVMEEKQRIEGDIEAKKVQIKQLTNNINKKKQEIDKDFKYFEQNVSQSIDTLNQEIASLEKGKNSKSKLCDDKIREIDNALKAIQDISAASAEEAKS